MWIAAVKAGKLIYASSHLFSGLYCDDVGRDSSVGIATAYGLNGPRIESLWGRDIPHLSRPALRPTQSPVQWVPGLFWG